MAIVKPLDVMETSLCCVDIDPPEDSVVRLSADAMLLATHHVPISGPPELNLKAILCKHITANCILTTVDMPLVYGYVTPVTDFVCK